MREITNGGVSEILHHGDCCVLIPHLQIQISRYGVESEKRDLAESQEGNEYQKEIDDLKCLVGNFSEKKKGFDILVLTQSLKGCSIYRMRGTDFREK